MHGKKKSHANTQKLTIANTKKRYYLLPPILFMCYVQIDIEIILKCFVSNEYITATATATQYKSLNLLQILL